MRLPEADAKQRFKAVRVVRLATSDQAGQPHVVVATFASVGNQVYLVVDEKPKTTRKLKRLRNIEQNPAVALLADHYEEDWERLWWVRADGRAEVVEEDKAAATAIELLVARYPQYQHERPQGPVIAVTIDHWTGWAAAPGPEPGNGAAVSSD